MESSFIVFPNISLSVLPVEWSSAVLNCISDANTPYDAVFEGQAVYLDVKEAFQVKWANGLKRFKTTKRGRLTGDILNALVHVSINDTLFGTGI